MSAVPLSIRLAGVLGHTWFVTRADSDDVACCCSTGPDAFREWQELGERAGDIWHRTGRTSWKRVRPAVAMIS